MGVPQVVTLVDNAGAHSSQHVLQAAHSDQLLGILVPTVTDASIVPSKDPLEPPVAVQAICQLGQNSPRQTFTHYRSCKTTLLDRLFSLLSGSLCPAVPFTRDLDALRRLLCRFMSYLQMIHSPRTPA